MENKCLACKEVVDDGFAIGKLCYGCIEETVIAFKQQQRFIRNNEFKGLVIKDFYCNGFFGRDFELENAVIISNDDKYITIRKANGAVTQASMGEMDVETIREYVNDWTSANKRR